MAEPGGVHVFGLKLAGAAVLSGTLDAHAGDAIELVLDSAHGIVGRSVGREILPAVVEQGCAGNSGAGGAGMLIAVQLFERGSDFLEQSPRVVVLLEPVDRLPGDVHGGIAAHHVTDETPPVFGRGKLPVQIPRASGQNQIDRHVPLIQVANALVELLKVSQVRSAGRGKYGVEALAHHQAAEVGELLLRARIGHGTKGGVVQEGEAQFGRAHPEVRQEAFGVGPMVDVGLLHKAGGIRGDGGERAFAGFQLGQVAADAIFPLARFGGSNTQHHAPAAVPESRNADGAHPGGTELGPQFHGGIRIRIGRGGLVAEFEDQVAGRVGGGVVARAGRRNGLRGEREWPGEEQEDRGSPTKRHKF